MCILKNYCYKDEEKKELSGYQKILFDMDMHIYLEKNMYRKIRHLCRAMFVFSIAIMVRWMISYYFDNEEKIEVMMEELNKEIENFEKNIKNWKKEIKSEELFSKISPRAVKSSSTNSIASFAIASASVSF